MCQVWGSEVSSPSIHNLLAGSRLKVTVESHLGNGLKVVLLGSPLAGYVHSTQLQVLTKSSISILDISVSISILNS